MLISARALKYKPDSSLLKQYKIVGMNKNDANHKQQLNTAGGGMTAHYSADSTNINSLQSEDVKKAVVWIERGDTIIKRYIKIGLNDDTNAQVIQGLNPNDVVIDGVQQPGKQTPSNNAVKSPFMPQRPGGNNQKPNQTRSS
jgi:HlyD family secretion protein